MTWFQSVPLLNNLPEEEDGELSMLQLCRGIWIKVEECQGNTPRDSFIFIFFTFPGWKCFHPGNSSRHQRDPFHNQSPCDLGKSEFFLLETSPFNLEIKLEIRLWKTADSYTKILKGLTMSREVVKFKKNVHLRSLGESVKGSSVYFTLNKYNHKG